MKIFTLAIDDKGEINISGSMSILEVKSILETISLQMSFNEGYQSERNKIRQGFRKRRREGK